MSVPISELQGRLGSMSLYTALEDEAVDISNPCRISNPLQHLSSTTQEE